MGHLEDSVIAVQKGTETFKVLVTYSCHCFTEELKPHHTPDFHYDYKHEKRAFCLVRHGLSHNLPNYIAGLLGKSVYLTQQTNFFFIRSNGGNYVVFFAIRPARDPKYDAILTVQSAHLRSNFIRVARAVTFDDLIEAKVKNTPVTPGPKQTIKRS
jgi:ribosomal protein S17E